MIDFAFVIAYLVVLIGLKIYGMNGLEAVWRSALGLGAIPPLFLLYFRLKMNEVGAGASEKYEG